MAETSLRTLLDIISLAGLTAIVAMLAILLRHRHVRLSHYRWFALGFALLCVTILFDLSQALNLIIASSELLLVMDGVKMAAILVFLAAVFGLRQTIIEKG